MIEPLDSKWTGVLVALGTILFLGCSSEEPRPEDPPSFSSEPKLSARVGIGYTYDVRTKDSANDSRTISALDLPSWLTLTDQGDGSAILTGIPTPFDTGLAQVSLEVVDVDGATTQDFAIDVESDFIPIAEEDEFDGEELSQFWKFFDPAGDSTLQVDGGFVEIDIPGGSAHDLWFENNSAPRILQSVEDRDFGIEVRFESIPELRYQIQGAIAQESETSFLRFELHHNGKEHRIYAASIRGDDARVRVNRPTEGAQPRFLRILRNGEFWTLQYSPDGSEWYVASAFSHPLVVREVGLFGGNAKGDTSPDFTALADYFHNTDLSRLPPIDLPEGPAVQDDEGSEENDGSSLASE